MNISRTSGSAADTLIVAIAVSIASYFAPIRPARGAALDALPAASERGHSNGRAVRPPHYFAWGYADEARLSISQIWKHVT